MKNLQKGFIALLLPVLIVVLLIGGGAYVYMRNKPQNQPVTGTTQSMSAVQDSNSQTVDWKTYTNIRKGYSVSYPADVKMDTSDLSCVKIFTKEFGFVFMDSGASEPCGIPTGLGVGMMRSQDMIIIANKQYSVSGWRESNNMYGFLTPNFSVGKTTVTYGVHHVDTSDPRDWKDLGALTEVEYQNALNSAKAIASTLKAN